MTMRAVTVTASWDARMSQSSSRYLDDSKSMTYNQSVAPSFCPVLEHCYTKGTEREGVEHTLWRKCIFHVIHRHTYAQPVFLC